ncbi:MAG: hypothetical protein NT137_04595 [Methanomassiliicoccales archaeon]|jgi:uncharacterized membrane-anchored protein|nr:hypothetical protein [Methanomassiliicoccales archaeon]
MELMDFLTVLLLTFGLFMILAGVFTAYFGSGKSRMIGVALLVVGLVVGILWIWMTMYGGPGYVKLSASLSSVIWTAFINIIAALVGALIAVGVFLLAIMKS